MQQTTRPLPPPTPMPSSSDTPALVWFRRDLRDYDHAALHHALQAHHRVYCAFCFDTAILDALPSRQDRRVEFILQSVGELDASLRKRGGGLIVLHGDARDELPRLAATLRAEAVYANRDYEPQAIARDRLVAERLASFKTRFLDFKDQVIFDRGEVLTRTGKPFSVFTPYKKAWLARLSDMDVQSHPVAPWLDRLAAPPEGRLPELADLGFTPGRLSPLPLPAGMSGAHDLWENFLDRLDDYHRSRDFPAIEGPSCLSVHLRFGTLSIRELVRHAWQHGGAGAESWLSELIWREFYQQLLFHHPHVVERAFRPAFDALSWVENEALFAAWCEGRTGYPFVDAGMRQLNETGYMHNRLRMITASFLTKDLGIHWLRGERYFAARLNDYDLAANNGGWQWAASTGCDAQPWFRIFNPVTQSEKFDPQGRFIRRYVPELASVPQPYLHAPWRMPPAVRTACGVRLGTDYPMPVVDHALAREASLARFSAAAG